MTEPENGFNVGVRTLTDLDASDLEVRRAGAEASPSELEAARRIIRSPRRSRRATPRPLPSSPNASITARARQRSRRKRRGDTTRACA